MLTAIKIDLKYMTAVEVEEHPKFIKIQENYFKFEKIFIFKYKGISVRVKRQPVRVKRQPVRT
jgi:hypothetical protein